MLLRLDDTALLTVFNDSGAINGWYLPQFLIQSVPAARQAKRATGNLAVSVLRDADRAFLDPHMPLDVPPPRSTRFGSPLVLSRVHWVAARARRRRSKS